jgi:predicted oxidoreductase
MPAYLADAGSGTFDACRLHEMQIQAWSPLRSDFLSLSGAEQSPSS